MYQFRNKSSVEEGLPRQRRTMRSYRFCPFVKTLIFLWMLGCLLDSTESATDNRCHRDNVCQTIESPNDHRQALVEAFSKTHAIDLIFIICNTSETWSNCSYDYGKVSSFIVSLVSLVSTKYGSYIDADRLHIAIIVYDGISPRVILNDIENSTPTVGNCEFDRFLNVSATTSKPGNSKLVESLTEANAIFGSSARGNARKILWLLTDCRCCGTQEPYQCDERQAVRNAAGDIRRGYDGSVLFTVGISPCPGGYFDTFPQEDTMKAIASTNTSYYACIDDWIKISNNEINSGNITESWSDISRDVNIGYSCKGCASSTSSSSNRCACKVTSKQYMCHEFPASLEASKLAIALGAGVGGGIFVIIVIVIIVVVARRCKIPNSPPPPLPRTRNQRPPPICKNQTYDNTDFTDNEDVEYEVSDLERSMPGWSPHLTQLKREHPTFLHLGVYSLDGRYFAQTPGFGLTESQRTALDGAMTNGNSGGKPRKKSDVTVGGLTYRIEKTTQEKLSARSENNKTRLLVAFREGYLVVGVVEGKGGKRCDEVIREITVNLTTPSV